MRRNVFAALVTLIMAATIAVPVVNAQQTIMRCNVPFAFNIGDKQLPAGAYVVHEMDRVTLIQSKDSENSVVGIYNNAGPSKADQNKLVFDKVGDHYFLTQIWSSARNEELLVPESKQEKELRASNIGPWSEVETVIVALR